MKHYQTAVAVAVLLVLLTWSAEAAASLRQSAKRAAQSSSHLASKSLHAHKSAHLQGHRFAEEHAVKRHHQAQEAVALEASDAESDSESSSDLEGGLGDMTANVEDIDNGADDAPEAGSPEEAMTSTDLQELEEVESKGKHEPSPQEKKAAMLQQSITEVTQQSNTAHTVFEKQLYKLEASILQMAKSAQNPSVAAFVTEIRGIMEDKMKGYLRNESSFMQNGTLNASCAKYDSCGGSRGNISVLGPQMFKMFDQKHKHKLCRIKEGHFAAMAQETCQLAHATKQVETEYCAFFNSNMTLGRAINGRTQCAKEGYHSTQEVRKYLQDQVDFWKASRDVATYAKGKCTQTAAAHNQTLRDCDTRKADRDKKKSECDVLQRKMDQSGCDFRMEWEGTCTNVDTTLVGQCLHKERQVYDAKWARALEVQAVLMSQMEVVLRMYCFLDAFTSADVAGGIATCRNQSFTNHTDVQGLKFVWCPYNVADSSGCGVAPKTHWSNENEYKAFYYAGTRQRSINCTASCCPNGTNYTLVVHAADMAARAAAASR